MNKRTLMGYDLETSVYIADLNTTYYCFLSGSRMLDLQTSRAGQFLSSHVFQPSLFYKQEVKVKVTQSCRLFATPWTIQSWNFPGQNTRVGSLSLLQGILPTQ